MDLAVDEDSTQLVFATGGSLRARAVVLALGQPRSGSGWLPHPVSSPRIISDPWHPAALDAVPPESDVLLVGTGLTMADIALTLTRPGRVVHAVSRHGLVPQRHVRQPPPTIPPPPYGECADLPALRRMVLRHAAVCRRVHGDWRPAIDGLRSSTSLLWQRLSPDDRRRFLAEDLRRWEVHRHRVPPGTADALAAACTEGRVSITSGRLTQATPTPGGFHIRLADGRSLHVGAVVNCTGAPRSVHDSTDPFIRALLRSGAARPGPLGLGLDTAPDGRLVTRDGHPPAPFWTLGALRLGNLSETTAIPEIRVQATGIATSVLSMAAAHAGDGAGAGVGGVLSST
ncbi:FAD/NAD(P)-binding protein [Streptomyces sp. NPDC101150]|uniref:FAD/NAD(P)-binding protein n=1 Tax=Streptomyces sp. NPDC101150 TaxID=3366114 RepID=UPI0038020EA8